MQHDKKPVDLIKTLTIMKTKRTLKQKNSGKKQTDLNRRKLTETNYHWPFDLKPNAIKKTLSFIGIFLITVLVSNPIQAQVNTADSNRQIVVKGTVSDADGPLLGVNIIHKGTDVGTTSDKDGVFMFPKALKPNDVLIFSYLGYETQELVITENTTLVKLILAIDAVVMRGALTIDQPYKSKRSL